MVMRTSTRDASHRAQTHASRGTLRKLDTKGLWSTAHVDVMASETHTEVEFAENYGSTSVPVLQDEEEEDQKGAQAKEGSSGSQAGGEGGAEGAQGKQPKGDAAEVILTYMNGSRSHPMITAIGDRRHRLKELEEGDVAQHRLKDDRQQVLLHKDGTYISTRDDKVFRAALVPKQDDKQQQPEQQQQANGAGGGTSGSGGGKQKKQKTHGQKSAREDNKKSEVYIHQDGKTIENQHSGYYSAQRPGDSSTYSENRKKSTQSTSDHTHIRFEDHRIFNDESGNWCTSPILVKKDSHCKE